MKGATDQLDLDGADLSERFETLGRYIDAAEEALGDALKPRATVADPAFYTQLAYSLVIAASRCLTGINAMVDAEQTARRDANFDLRLLDILETYKSKLLSPDFRPGFDTLYAIQSIKDLFGLPSFGQSQDAEKACPGCGAKRGT